MKYQNYLLSAAILLFGACSSENDPLVEKTNQLVKVSFNIELEPEIIPFGTKAMPSNLPSEPEAENSSSTNVVLNVFSIKTKKGSKAKVE